MSLEVQQAEWKLLVPHAARSALFFLDPAHELLEVGQAIADDDTTRVKALLASGDLRRPDDAELDVDPDSQFRFVIVQPYVVAQGPVS